MSALNVFQQLGVKTDDQFVAYHVALRCIDKLVGGIPSDESVIRGWLKARMDLNDRALQEMVDKILHERFPDGQPEADALADALMETDAAPSVNGFLRHPETKELVYEGRCMKSALTEFANSAYPGTEWPGKTAIAKGFRKGLKSALEERVFVEQIYIGLGVKEPTGIEERIKHVTTPQGPRSSITRVEYVYQPTLEFTLLVRDDFLPLEAWSRIWQAGEQIGIGSDRGRSDGRFELLAFDRLPGGSARAA